MKKITKLLMPILVCASAITPIIATTSCNKTTEDSAIETWTDYIYNRTFSLYGTSDYGTGSIGQCWGTAWVLSDATPSNTEDYIYYIVTNWHVMKGIDSIKQTGSTDKIYFGCNTQSAGLDSSDYIEFKSFSKELETYFTYNNSSEITTTETYIDPTTGLPITATRTGKRGCDIFVAKADFSSFVTSASRSAPIAKNKLNKLNSLTASGKKITELAETTAKNKHHEKKKMYTGGYPVISSTKRAKWEKHDLSVESVTLQYDNGTQNEAIASNTHWSDTTNKPLTDCCPQYIGSNVGSSWMTGGSSGSMLVGNFGTDTEPIWKICGIYWGGKQTTDGKLYPYFSIFNSDWKNYLAKWA